MRKLALAFLVLLAACRRGEPPGHAGFVDARVASVASVISGQVISVPVREGDLVKKGQLLVQLDAREREVAVEQAQANLDRSQQSLLETEETFRSQLPTVQGAGADIQRARAALREAEINYQRTKKLVAGKAAPGSDLDTARSQLDQARATYRSLQFNRSAVSGRTSAAEQAVCGAQAAVNASEVALRLAQVQLEQAQVTSPFDGLVVQRNLFEGEWAAPGTPVITVEDRSELWVRLDVGEDEIRGVEVGQPAEVRVLAMKGQTLRGHVMEVGAEGDFALNRDVKRGTPDLRTFRVRVAIEGAQPELRPGMTAEVRLQPQGPQQPAKASPKR
jgi:multidrug resistance efflux pump